MAKHPSKRRIMVMRTPPGQINPSLDARDSETEERRKLGRQLGRRLGVLFRARAGIRALGGDVAVDELDHAEWRIVAEAEPGLHDPGIAALPLLVAGAEHVEQLPHHG